MQGVRRTGPVCFSYSASTPGTIDTSERFPGTNPLRHGIVTTWPEGMTPENTPDGKPGAFCRPVLPDGFKPVRRAGGIITTHRRLQRRKRPLIEPNSADQCLLEQSHSFTSRSSDRSCSNPTSYASGLARTRISRHPWPEGRADRSSTRAISFNRLLSKFLRTAAARIRVFGSPGLFRGFGTTNPIRERTAGEAETKTSRLNVLLLFPRRKSARISSDRVTRASRGKRFPPDPDGDSSVIAALRRASDY